MWRETKCSARRVLAGITLAVALLGFMAAWQAVDEDIPTLFPGS